MESVELAIETVEMVGLGRGRGFMPINRRSVDFSSPVVGRINSRLLDIVSMMISKGVMSEQDLVEKLQLNYVSNDDYASLSDELRDAEEQLEEANLRIESYTLRFGRMSRLIAESLGEDFENWCLDEEDEEDNENDEGLEDEESESISFLEFGVDRIIDEFLALKEDREGENRSE